MYTVVSGYRFLEMNDLESLKVSLKTTCSQLELKGTILLSHEGININLAGNAIQIDQFIQQISEESRFTNIPYKFTTSDTPPFKKLMVKIKEEIITMKKKNLVNQHPRAKALSAKELKEWYNHAKDFTILDTRNDYEIKFGSFEQAVQLPINHFHQFEESVIKDLTIDKNKAVVTFCTGGVRCEKAALVLEKLGYTDVYQLDGGILQYFNECGGEHYHGDCFVFDERVALTPDLKTSDKKQCLVCNGPVLLGEQNEKGWIEKKACVTCYQV